MAEQRARPTKAIAENQPRVSRYSSTLFFLVLFGLHLFVAADTLMSMTNATTAKEKTMDLSSYDLIVVNTSAGKDSQAMMTHLVEMADAQGVSRDRLVAVHSDLGRAEWQGTGDLAREQADHYGIRFVVTRREDDLLDYVERRGMWPSSAARFCTSEFKRAPVSKAITALTRELREAGLDRPARILNCMGIRAEESAARAKKNPIELNKRLTGKGIVKVVTDWFPIFDWTADEVWGTIHRSGVRYHRAYDLGMPRLSCVFCVFAPKAALMIAGRENPELLDEYVATEARIGHDFKNGFAISEIREALSADDDAAAAVSIEVSLDDIAAWNM